MTTATASAPFSLEIVLTNGKLGRCLINALDANGKVVHSDKADLASTANRDKIAQAFASRLALDLDTVKRQVEECWIEVVEQHRQAQAATPAAAASPGAASTQPTPTNPLLDTPADILKDAEAYLNDPALMTRIADDIERFGVAGERELVDTIYLIATSRLLPRPLSGIVQGSSSSGKSFAIEKAARLIPPECVIWATQMTPQALFHMPPDSLQNRLIVGGERSRLENDDRAEATRALREMISSGRLSKMMPVKVAGGKIETQLIEQEGPIAFLESTTLARVFAEDENRCLLLQTDETEQQTTKIIKLTAQRFQHPVPPELERLTLVHHTLQRLLQTYLVAIPFANLLAVLFPTSRVEARRAFTHTLNLISASTLLHQKQRQFASDGRLLAARRDYEIARQLLLRPLARLLGDAVSEAARRFHGVLVAKFPVTTVNSDVGSGPFTVAEAKRLATGSTSAVRGWMHELQEAGVMEPVVAARGNKPATWRLVNDTVPASTIVLPTADRLFGP